MNRRLRLMVALARKFPHPEPPQDRYLLIGRMEPSSPAVRRVLFGPIPRQVSVTDRTLPLEGHPLRARVYRPRDRTRRLLPLVVSFHGGGFVFGNLAQMDWLCAQVALRANAVVVSVSYRLAPEHPAPIPYRDCRSATEWLLDNADSLGADRRGASVMGASAGGNLAALVALDHRDRCRRDPALPPLAHQVLIYPATDLTLASPSVAELAEAPILTRSIMDWYGRRYLPQGLTGSITSDDPRVSPLFAADHAEVAPALIIAAGQDPLRDDASRYADVLRRAGVPTRLVTYPDAIHGFASMPRLAPEAPLAVREIASELTLS